MFIELKIIVWISRECLRVYDAFVVNKLIEFGLFFSEKFVFFCISFNGVILFDGCFFWILKRFLEFL